MSSLIVPDVGKIAFLDGITGVAPTGSLVNALVHFFVNNVLIDAATVLADLIEASYSGYTPQTLGGWSAAVIAAMRGQSTSVPNIFDNTSGLPQDIYGIFVTDSTGALLMAADFGGAAFPVPVGSTAVIITMLDASLF